MKLRVCALFAVLLVLCVCVCAFVGCDEDESAAPIDQIDKFEIRVSPNSDGTLNMSYEITWQVLLNSTEPLQDVYVGVPNRFVSGIVMMYHTYPRVEKEQALAFAEDIDTVLLPIQNLVEELPLRDPVKSISLNKLCILNIVQIRIKASIFNSLCI